MEFAARPTKATAFLLVLVALVVCTPRARADDRPLALAVTLATADECFTLEPLLEDIAAFLERTTVDVRLTAVVQVGDGTASFEVLRDGAPGGRRRFARLPRACADRRAVVALALALALDESAAVTPTLEPPSRSVALPHAHRRSASGLDHTPANPPEASQPIEIELAIAAGVLLGALPVPTPIITVDATLAPWRGISLGIGGLVTTQIDAAIGVGVAHVDLVGGRVSLCLKRPIATPNLWFTGCLGTWLAAARARGDGFSVNHTGTAPWLAVSARAELTARIADWVALFAAADGLALPTTPTLAVTSGDAPTTRRELTRAGVAVTAGLTVRLR